MKKSLTVTLLKMCTHMGSNMTSVRQPPAESHWCVYRAWRTECWGLQLPANVACPGRLTQRLFLAGCFPSGLSSLPAPNSPLLPALYLVALEAFLLHNKKPCFWGHALSFKFEGQPLVSAVPYHTQSCSSVPPSQFPRAPPGTSRTAPPPGAAAGLRHRSGLPGAPRLPPAHTGPAPHTWRGRHRGGAARLGTSLPGRRPGVAVGHSAARQPG